MNIVLQHLPHPVFLTSLPVALFFCEGCLYQIFTYCTTLTVYLSTTSEFSSKQLFLLFCLSSQSNSLIIRFLTTTLCKCFSFPQPQWPDYQNVKIYPPNMTSINAKGLNSPFKRNIPWEEAITDILCAQETNFSNVKPPSCTHKRYSHYSFYKHT